MPAPFCGRQRRSAPPEWHFSKGTVSPYNPKCLRASAGSIFRVPVVAALDQQLFLAAAEQRKIALFALMPKGTTDVGEVELGRQVRHHRGQRRARRERTAARQGHGRSGFRPLAWNRSTRHWRPALRYLSRGSRGWRG